jgi:hypothetical protein
MFSLIYTLPLRFHVVMFKQSTSNNKHNEHYILQITDGTSTYEAEPRGPKSRIECKHGIAVQHFPSRDEHLKMAA